MTAFADSRRRLLARMGRTMTLHRADASASDLPVTGYLTTFRPETGNPPLQQGEAVVELMDDEIAAAGQAAPDLGTMVIIDTETWAVLPGGAHPVYSGVTRIGWTLHVKGGAS